MSLLELCIELSYRYQVEEHLRNGRIWAVDISSVRGIYPVSAMVYVLEDNVFVKNTSISTLGGGLFVLGDLVATSSESSDIKSDVSLVADKMSRGKVTVEKTVGKKTLFDVCAYFSDDCSMSVSFQSGQINSVNVSSNSTRYPVTAVVSRCLPCRSEQSGNVSVSYSHDYDARSASDDESMREMTSANSNVYSAAATIADVMYSERAP